MNGTALPLSAPAPRMIFIVGNSRSGTTMLGRVFGAHPLVHMFGELHYFEQVVDAQALRQPQPLTRDAAVGKAASLLAVARQGLFAGAAADPYRAEAEKLLSGAPAPGDVSLYLAVLDAETRRAGREIPLEQTPRYLYLAQEILTAIPGAQMICITRDPRDVLLSQKNRWRRTLGRHAGGKGVPLIWTLRSWANYHPWLTARLWLTAARKAEAMQDHPRFHRLRYEDLLSNPEPVLRDLCARCGLSFDPAMLAVRQIGSSTRADRPEALGFDASRMGLWQQGGLGRAEVAICEAVAAEQMARLGYVPSGRRAPALALGLQYALLPVKMAVALAANLRRFRNLTETIRRRLG